MKKFKSFYSVLVQSRLHISYSRAYVQQTKSLFQTVPNLEVGRDSALYNWVYWQMSTYRAR